MQLKTKTIGVPYCDSIYSRGSDFTHIHLLLEMEWDYVLDVAGKKLYIFIGDIKVIFYTYEIRWRAMGQVIALLADKICVIRNF